MIHRILVLAVIVLAPSLVAAQANHDAIAKQLEANQRAISTAIEKGDLASFKALVADDAISINDAGMMAVSEFIKMFNQFKGQSVTIDQVKTLFLNDNAAVLTYRSTPKGSVMSLASTAFANRGGKWVAVFHQETIPTPPPAKKQ